ncbi:MAG: glycoside hydrolase family 10 protein [Phycisphaerales bacterium]
MLSHSKKLVLGVCLGMLLAMFLGSGCVIERNQRRVHRVEDSAPLADHFGLWVTRWDYRREEDVRQVITDAASIGITDIYWQVRGQADAYYRSRIESWGEELTRPIPTKGTPNQAPEASPANSLAQHRSLEPGFDPLKLAIIEAHRRGIRVHAWINVMPIWRGKTMPIDQTHLLYTHPEWRLYDETGKPQPMGKGYIVINPVLDEVQDYLVSVVRDLVDRYPVDGIHLDYIRFLSDELSSEKLYPGDAKSLSLYARMVGDRATPGQINRTRYRLWIRDRITTLVERIGREAIGSRPNIHYSSAVWRRPDLASERYLQDAATWVRHGTVDAIMPMIYTDKESQFEDDIQAWYQAVDRKRVIAGIGTYKHDSPGETLMQLTLAHPRRFVLFAYSSIFESVHPGQERDQHHVDLRAHKQEALRQYIQQVGRNADARD